LRECSPLRRKQTDTHALRVLCASRARRQLFNGFKDRLGLENHPVAAAERAVINLPVLIPGPTPQVMGRRFNQPGRARPSHDAVIKRLPKKVREDRDDVEAQHG
jgi:hypothetical protein